VDGGVVVDAEKGLAARRNVDRLAAVQEVPTIAESGINGTQGFDSSTWFGLFAPSGMPKSVMDRLRTEMAKALGSDELHKAWNSLGAETPDLYGDAFGKFVSAEVKRWAEVVKHSGAKLE